MEGLIPFVIHAIKKKREESEHGFLSCYSASRRGSSRRPLVEGSHHDGSSHSHSGGSYQEIPPAAGAKANKC